MKQLCLFLFFSLYCFTSYSQDTLKAKNRIDYFPKNNIFSIIYLDPLACNIYGGIHVLFEEGNKKNGVFIPVNLGFNKPFFRYETNKIQLELGLEAAAFTQFEIVHVSGNTYLGGLYNNDYKASGYISAYHRNLFYKLSLFHISSHLGDDYMIRNEDFSTNDKSVNYEQVNLTVLKKIKNTEYYSGVGYVITPNAFRERYSFQAGFQFNIENEKAYQWIGGTDIKAFDQNDFYPNIRAAIGTEYFNGKDPAFRIQLELYHGHLPYSTQEYRKVTWVGISSNIEI